MTFPANDDPVIKENFAVPEDHVIELPPEAISDLPPERFLAVEDFGAIRAISPGEFERLLNLCQAPVWKKGIPVFAEAIHRSATLLIALIADGGLCLRNPERQIERLVIDPEGAKTGYVRLQPRALPKERRGTSTMGSRQFPHRLGRLHLQTYVYFRCRRMDAKPGEPLLPPLPGTWKELRQLIGPELAWLTKGGGKVSWTAVFGKWLSTQLAAARPEIRSEALRKRIYHEWSVGNEGASMRDGWNAVVARARWRLLERDRFSFLVGLRSEKNRFTSIPEGRFQALANYRTRLDETNDPDSVPALLTLIREPVSEGEFIWGNEPGEEVSEGEAFDGDEIHETTEAEEQNDLILIRKLLKNIEEAGSVAISKDDLNECHQQVVHPNAVNLLTWIEHLVRKRRKPNTVITYAGIVVRFLEAFGGVPFETLTLDDVAGFIDDYTTPSSVRLIRTVLRLHDRFLHEIAAIKRSEPISWNSTSLRAYEQYRERPVLTERQYINILARVAKTGGKPFRSLLEAKVLFTLLRRCGLRSVEAANLSADCIFGVTQPRLYVIRSKTRAGRRMLPLEFLLSGEELEWVLEWRMRRIEKAGPKAWLFEDAEGEPISPKKLAARVGRFMGGSETAGDTAHGLRHAFANSQLAAWWCETATFNHFGQNRARRLLREFYRPGIDGRAVSNLHDIQFLLGHADLKVTFERYIHILDLMQWDTVLQDEDRRRVDPVSDSRNFLTAGAALDLLGADSQVFRIHFSGTIQRNRPIEFSAVEKIAVQRLGLIG
jgi:integrase